MSNTEIQIRLATINDIPSIFEVLEHNLIQKKSSTQNASLEATGFLIHGFSPEDLQSAILDAKNHIVLVATENNAVVGYALSYDLRHIKPDWTVDIHGTPETHALLVKEKVLYHRHIAKLSNKKSIGSKILIALIGEAERRNYSYIVCQIVQKPLQNTVSTRLHQKFGFLEVGYVEDHQYLFGIFLKSML